MNIVRYFDQIAETVDDYFEQGLIEENKTELLDTLTTLLGELVPDEDEAEVKEWNDFVNAYGSIIYSCKHHCSPYITDDDLSNVFNDFFESTFDDQEFVDFLQGIHAHFLDSQKLQDQLDDYPQFSDFELPHYLIIMSYLLNLSTIHDMKKLNKEARDHILSAYSHLGELGLYLHNQFNSPAIISMHDGYHKDFDFDAVLTILEYEEKLDYDKRYKELSDKLQEELNKSKDFTLETIDEKVKAFLDNENLFNEFSKYDDIMTTLRTGEWFWSHHIEVVKDTRDYILDWTNLAVSYFKTVEIYLFEKIFELCQGKHITRFKNDEGLLISEENHKEIRNLTIGSYYNFLKKYENASICLKLPSNNKWIVEQVEKWNNETRNSKLHKNLITDEELLIKVKSDTKALLKILVSNFK